MNEFAIRYFAKRSTARGAMVIEDDLPVLGRIIENYGHHLPKNHRQDISDTYRGIREIVIDYDLVNPLDISAWQRVEEKISDLDNAVRLAWQQEADSLYGDYAKISTKMKLNDKMLAVIDRLDKESLVQLVNGLEVISNAKRFILEQVIEFTPQQVDEILVMTGISDAGIDVDSYVKLELLFKKIDSLAVKYYLDNIDDASYVAGLRSSFEEYRLLFDQQDFAIIERAFEVYQNL